MSSVGVTQQRAELAMEATQSQQSLNILSTRLERSLVVVRIALLVAAIGTPVGYALTAQRGVGVVVYTVR